MWRNGWERRIDSDRDRYDLGSTLVLVMLLCPLENTSSVYLTSEKHFVEIA